MNDYDEAKGQQTFIFLFVWANNLMTSSPAMRSHGARDEKKIKSGFGFNNGSSIGNGYFGGQAKAEIHLTKLSGQAEAKKEMIRQFYR